MNPFAVSVWYRSAVGWGVSFTVLLIYLFVAFNVFGLEYALLKDFLSLSLFGCFVLLVIGKVMGKSPNRVLAYVLTMGFFGFVPLAVTLGVIATGFSLALSASSRYIFLSSLFIVTIAWCTYQMHGYRRRIIDRQYIEQEFLIERDKIYMRLPSEVSLDTRPLNNETLWGRLYNKFGPYLFLLIPFAYPLQKLVTNESGFLGGLFLAALFAAPLAIYLLGRLTCGAYLYVYRVWQLEREYGKPVMFSSNE